MGSARAAQSAGVRAIEKGYPPDDFATPDDVALAALFLGSPAARIITGVALPVDGGLLAGNRVVMAREPALETFS